MRRLEGDGMNMNPKLLSAVIAVGLLAIAIPSFIYEECRIDVPNKHIAVLTHKIGKDLERGDVLAPSPEYKGVQQEVLTEGRYYYNPYAWSWQVVPQVEIPEGKLGVRIRMYGEDLPAGELIAENDNQKGIVAEVLQSRPLSAYNAWVIDPDNPSAAANKPTRENYAETDRTARSGHDSRRLQRVDHRAFRPHAQGRGRQSTRFGQGRKRRANRRRWSRAPTI